MEGMASPRSGNPARRAQLDGTAAGRATARDWIAASRPRTLGMAIAPVALGTAAREHLASLN